MGNVSLLEGFWILVNTVTLAYVLNGLSDARADREAARVLKALPSQILVLADDVRNERLRLVKVLLLMAVAIPGIFFADGEVRPTLFRVLPIVVLMALALVLLYQSFTDARQRKRLLVLVTKEALDVKTDALDRIEHKVDESIVVAREAADASNHTKERFDAVYTRIEAGEALADSRHPNDEQLAGIAAEVHDLHTGDAPVGK